MFLRASLLAMNMDSTKHAVQLCNKLKTYTVRSRFNGRKMFKIILRTCVANNNLLKKK